MTQILSRAEAARYLGIKPQTLAVWASTRRYALPYLKIGRSVRYRIADLDEFIRTHVVLQGDMNTGRTSV